MDQKRKSSRVITSRLVRSGKRCVRFFSSFGDDHPIFEFPAEYRRDDLPIAIAPVKGKAYIKAAMTYAVTAASESVKWKNKEESNSSSLRS